MAHAVALQERQLDRVVQFAAGPNPEVVFLERKRQALTGVVRGGDEGAYCTTTSVQPLSAEQKVFAASTSLAHAAPVMKSTGC